MICKGCGKETSVTAFATFRTRKGEIRRRGVCQDCRTAYQYENREKLTQYRKEYNEKTKTKRQLQQKQRREEASLVISAYKERTPCMDCGNKFPAVCMDFDHIEGRGPKTRGVAVLVAGGYKLPLILAEMQKCELVCANCHRIRTALRRDNLPTPYKIRPLDATGKLPDSTVDGDL